MNVMSIPLISIRARNTSADRRHLLYYPEQADHDNALSMTSDSSIANEQGATGINSKRSPLPITPIDAKPRNSTLNLSASRFISHEASYMTVHATKVDTSSEDKTASQLHERSNRCHDSKPLLQRPLGGLEVMYHHSLSKGTDMIYLMTKIETNFPVTPARARNALFLLAEKHSMLRMTIQCKDVTQSDDISFLEMGEVKLDFLASERKDWLQFIMEEVAIPFDIVNGPLWRCRLLGQPDSCFNSVENYTSKKVVGEADKRRKQDDKSKLKHDKTVTKNGFVYDSIFLFILHHSMMDGKYFLWLFNHFSEILAKVEDKSIDRISVSETFPLLPPAEHVIVPTISNISENKNPYSKSCSSIHVDLTQPSDKVLNDYNQRFSQDIKDSNSRQPRNQYMLHEFGEVETYNIMKSCKEAGASANGACLAASVLALADLVYPSAVLENFDIPFEFMLDLRRYCPSDLPENITKCFPGVFSTHIPMRATLKLTNRPVTYREFWNMSRSFGKTIQNELKSPEKIFQCLRKTLNDSRTMETANANIGKSATVLCVSNLGCLDGVLTEDVKKKVRLAKLFGHSTVLIEDSPIFYVNNYLLNERLVVNVSFCENYTSSSTTMEYIENFKKYVLIRPKL